VRAPVSIPVLLEGWVDHAPGVAADGLCLDADRVEPGQAFVVIADGRLDGIEDAKTAVSRGACVLIHDQNFAFPRLGVPTVAVPHLGRRLSALAARFYRHPVEQLATAGIAGSKGRTSTAHYLAQSWQRVNGGAGLVSASGQGPFRSLNVSENLPADPVALQGVLSHCIEHGVEMLAMEVLPRFVEQGWTDDVGFDVAVFTGMRDGRRVKHDAQASEREAVRSLFSECCPRFAVVNHDEAEGKTLTRLMAHGTQVLTYGTNGSTELHGSVLDMDSAGMSISISSPWGGGELRTGLLGRQNLSNLLATGGTLALMGMPWNRVMHQLEIMSAIPGQMSCIGGEPGQPAAVIDHARTPEELEEALLTLRSHLHGHLFCVLGNSSSWRKEMRRVAESYADRVFTASVAGRSESIHRALRESGRGDIVLFAGTGHGDWRRDGEAAIRELMEDAA
jgi:UDP-N-acetylmuramoyl-L-alanyl-D-glutamate--2,6-diaminopimelate ligase